MDDLAGGDKKKSTGPRKRYEIPKTATCHVCGDQAAEHLHYGGIACYSCRAFFRRTVNNTRPVLDCSNSNNCKINKDTRKRCQSCRFQKCKDIGMKPSWVLSELEKSRLQDCGRRTGNPGSSGERASSQSDQVLVKKEEDDYSEHGQQGVPIIKEERRLSGDPDARLNNQPEAARICSSQSEGGRASGSQPDFDRGRSGQSEFGRAGSSQSESGGGENVRLSSSGGPRIKQETGSSTPYDCHPSNSPHGPQRPAAASWATDSGHQQQRQAAVSQWDRQPLNSPWSQRPSSVSGLPSSGPHQPRPSSVHSLPSGNQHHHHQKTSSLMDDSHQHNWSEFSRHAAELASQEYEARNNPQKESLFPFNKMQVSLSAPGRDALSFTIETHQTNEPSWRQNIGMGRQIAVSTMQGNQNTSYSGIDSQAGGSSYVSRGCQPPDAAFQGCQPSSVTSCQTTPSYSPNPVTAATAAANMFQNKFTPASSQQQQQFEMGRPSPGPNRYQPAGQPVPVRSPSPDLSVSHTPTPATAAESDTEKLFEEYLQGNGTSSSHRDSVLSVISREDRESDNRSKLLSDWENCGGPAKRIKREDSDEQRSILQMIDAASGHHRTFSQGTRTPPPIQSSFQPFTATSPSTPLINMSQPLMSTGPVPRLFSPPCGYMASPATLAASSPPNSLITTSPPSQGYGDNEYNSQESPNQDPHSSDITRKSEQFWKFGEIPQSSFMDNIQETIFLEQLTAIDDTLKSQVPMDEEHCRAFMLSALTGNKLRQYTILHAYQILIKRIVRLSNSIQDFIELPPGDMHKLLVANTVSMINIRISRWFHPQTSLEKQLSLCSAGIDLYKEVTLQQDLDPQFVERPIDCEDVFVSPWCCDSTFEDRYFFLLKKMHKLPLDSTPLILLSVVMLFNSEKVTGLDQIKLIVTHERKFSFLLFRYLQNTYPDDQAQKYFQMFFECKSYLMEMADILINKRLIC